MLRKSFVRDTILYNRFSSAGNGNFYFLSSRMHIARSRAHSCICRFYVSIKSYKKRKEEAIIEKRNVLKRMHRAEKEERERPSLEESAYIAISNRQRRRAATTDCAKRACRDYRRLFCRR